MAETQAARQKLVADFNAVITDSEELLKQMATAGGEKATVLRGDLERKLQSAKQRFSELERAAVARTRAAAKEADEYVHAHPWQSIAVSAAIAGAAGIVLGLLLNRR